MAKKQGVSIYISYVLRHHPEDIGLEMDQHGWVSVKQLIDGINSKGKYLIDLEALENIVNTDNKGRYRLNKEHTKIKACQGHSIPWVEPEVEYLIPPQFLYHGTTTSALDKIMDSGEIKRMSRHAVHMQAEKMKAWQSAKRWHLVPVVLQIAAKEMHSDGFVFGKTENDVWCTECVPKKYIADVIREE